MRLPRGTNTDQELLKLQRKVKKLEERINHLEKYIQLMEGPQ